MTAKGGVKTASPSISGEFQNLRWDRIADVLPVGVYACDRRARLIHYNEQAAALWGSRPKTGAAEPCNAYLLEGACLRSSETPIAEVLATGKPAPARELIISRPDGSRILVQASAKPLLDDDELIGAIGCIQEVAAAPHKENKADETEHRLHALLQALPAAIYTTDMDGNVTFYNEAAVELAGRRPEPGQKWCVTWRLYTPDGTPLPHEECSMAVALRERRAVRGQSAIAERPDGTRVAFMPYPTPLTDADGRMVGAINMLVDLTAHNAAGLQSAYLAAIVASSDDAIISKTLDGYITSWNTGAQRIFGYEAEEMLGQSILRLIPAELHGEERQILAKLRRGEHIEHFDTVRLAKDGRRVDLSLSVSPVRDQSGRLIGASKVGRDITERKQAEKLQALLVGELNHRVKNTLATVQAIANQTVRMARSPTEFATSFNGRLQALARMHTLLTSNTWQGADVLPLIRDQLSIRDSEDPRITLSGPSVVIDPQTALHLALVLHELTTNAHKYGALSVPTGRLLVKWVVHTNGGRNLLLEWQESGGPPVRAPTSRGFGTTLIEQSLRSHGGSAAIRYEAHGVGCEISLPINDQTAPDVPVPRSRGEIDTAAAGPVPRSHRAAIRGKRVLVVEDEPLVAMDVVSVLEEAGCEVVGPAATFDGAKALIEVGGFDVALLDANLGGEPVDELAAALTRANIPFAFVTGYSREGLPQAFRHAPMLGKPSKPDGVVGVVVKLVAQGGDVIPLKQKAT